jgi:hypothetical protein
VRARAKAGWIARRLQGAVREPQDATAGLIDRTAETERERE